MLSDFPSTLRRSLSIHYPAAIRRDIPVISTVNILTSFVVDHKVNMPHLESAFDALRHTCAHDEKLASPERG
jgi:hypothetical protein